ncbi:hyaluronidase-1-like [Brachyhypopomus gauderio]|uniref:hyaluronidase-1-like n=1 Tax=Brachyhypopomus gauderio TaxID=698409 RepID=UPI0040412410
MVWRVCTLALLIFTTCLGNSVTRAGPDVGRRGFSVVWNMPTSRCERLHGVTLPLQKYGIIHNVEQKFLGEGISLFYECRLGLYPHVSRQNRIINGGIPQQGHLEGHLTLTEHQLHVLLGKHFAGLAVLDWEAWQPLWRQNFGTRKVYKRLSRLLVWQRHSEMSEENVTSLATEEFETAARAFMEGTLRLGVRVRPRGLWGFYGLPGCYNYHGAKRSGYTGQCKPSTETMNDRLAFLWQHSTALYPSVYVSRKLAGHPDTRLMMRHRILEALRVASQHAPSSQPIPVLPYARVAFIHTLQFLNQTDLEHTLGEAAALGAAGVVLWGELSFTKSRDQCVLLRDYINSVLGVYVKTLQQATTRCSQIVCHGNGRCARRKPHSGHTIPVFHDECEPDVDLPSHFKCVCYEGWSGARCENTERV